MTLRNLITGLAGIAVMAALGSALGLCAASAAAHLFLA